MAAPSPACRSTPGTTTRSRSGATSSRRSGTLYLNGVPPPSVRSVSRARMSSMRSSPLFYATWKQSARSSSSCSTTTRRSRIAAVMTRSTSSSNGCRATSHWPSRRDRIHRSRWGGCAPSRSCSSFVPSTSASPRTSRPPSSTRSCTLASRLRLLGALQERTEGWPVGVHLAAMSLSQEADRAGFVARFGGASRHIVDYLTEVVLDTLDEERHQFLLETSVLDTMCGPLCDAATGRQGSAEALVELERANLFLIPLDDRREWYRYHELFADVLRNRLLQCDPELARAVHQRASEWLGREGDRHEAVRHAVAARALESATTLVLEDWRPSFEQDDAAATPPGARGASLAGRRARCATRRRQGLGAERAQSPRRLAGRARIGRSRPDRNRRCLAVSRSRLRPALTRACFPWGDSARMLCAAERASELLGDTFSIGRPVSLLALGWARRFTGEHEAARAPLEQAAFLAARSSQWLVAGIAKAMLARITLETDDVDAAVSGGGAGAEHARGSRRRRRARRRHCARGPWCRPRPRERARRGSGAARSRRVEPSGPRPAAGHCRCTARVRLGAPRPRGTCSRAGDARGSEGTPCELPGSGGPEHTPRGCRAHADAGPSSNRR